MTLKEYTDQHATLHIHTAISALELNQAAFHIREAVYERIVRQMVVELAPMFREELERNIDWARIRKGIEDAIIAQSVSAFKGAYDERPTR